MPSFAGRPSTKSSSIPVEIPQNPLVGQQRQQTSELQFDKIPYSTIICLCWKIRFKNQVTTCSDFPSDAMLWINEVDWSMHWTSKNPRDQFMWRIFQTLSCWTRRLLLHWTRSSRIPNSRRRSVSRSRKPRKRTGFYGEDTWPSWSTSTFE